MAVVMVDSSYLEKDQYNTFLALLRITDTELDEKILSSTTPGVGDENQTAEGYIGAKVLNIQDIPDNTMIIMKQLWISYRLYQKIEREEVAVDKRQDLDDMLEIYNLNQEKRSKNEVNKNMKSSTMFVYSSSSPSEVER